MILAKIFCLFFVFGSLNLQARDLVNPLVVEPKPFKATVPLNLEYYQKKYSPQAAAVSSSFVLEMDLERVKKIYRNLKPENTEQRNLAKEVIKNIRKRLNSIESRSSSEKTGDEISEGAR